NTPAQFALLSRPTLCLTDLATFRTPGYKADNVCWGDGEGVSVAVMAGSGTAGLDEGSTGIDVELSRDSSRCAFPAGNWNAELSLAPFQNGGADRIYTINAQFVVGDALASGGPAPSGTVAPGSSCWASVTQP
ncbi:MAG: hypothetical protein QOI92_2908, partial [Chloroflexota bacterium]|nr:hypothetical protein [Chloroflexota bacterium]